MFYLKREGLVELISLCTVAKNLICDTSKVHYVTDLYVSCIFGKSVYYTDRVQM